MITTTMGMMPTKTIMTTKARMATTTIMTARNGHDHDEDGPHGHSHADHDHDEASHGHHHHHHGGLDPHAWQDALNVRHYVANIAERPVPGRTGRLRRLP